MSDTAAIAVDVLSIVATVAGLIVFIKYRRRPLGMLGWVMVCAVSVASSIRYHYSKFWIILGIVACVLPPAGMAWDRWRRSRRASAETP